jgi:hypothetical protein
MAKRTTLTLEDTDEALLASFEQPESLERQALIGYAAEHGWNVSEYRLTSEGALVRTLLRVGAETLRERALEIGYAQLEASYTDEERAEMRALRARYAEHVDRWIPE